MSTDELYVDFDKKVQSFALKVPSDEVAFLKFFKEFHSRATL